MKVTITKDITTKKKYKAVFTEDGKKVRTVRFGQQGADDYTRGATEEQKKSYRARHAGDNLNDKFSPGALSMYVLWTSKSLSQGIKNYKSKFNLK